MRYLDEDEDWPGPSGPSAPWVADEDISYEYTLRQNAHALMRNLRRRLEVLESNQLTVDLLLKEIQRQTAEAAVDGNVVGAADLSEMAISLFSLHQDRSNL